MTFVNETNTVIGTVTVTVVLALLGRPRHRRFSMPELNKRPWRWPREDR
jgi:hypothetical protein